MLNCNRVSANWHLNSWAQKIKNNNVRTKAPRPYLSSIWSFFFSRPWPSLLVSYSSDKIFNFQLICFQASAHNKNLDVGANIFIGNLDPEIDEKLLYDTFSAFGVILQTPKVASNIHYSPNLKKKSFLAIGYCQWYWPLSIWTYRSNSNELLDWPPTMPSICTSLLNQVYTHSTWKWTCNY